VHILGAPPSLASPPIVPEMAGSSSDSDAGEQLLHDDGGHSGAVTCLPGVCFSCVSSGNVGVVQRFGRYIGYQEPGCIPYCPCLDTITTVSMKTKQLACNTDCKTHDNVTLRVSTSITYRVNKKMLKAAVFDIDNPEYQMQAYVDNVVRSLLPTMDLDDAYSNKDTLCHQILAELQRSMAPYGHHILNALVTDLSPDPAVLQAMNAINAAKRHRMAASEQAEAQKVLLVKAAEADAESKYLAGTGIARMRRAMAEGVKESMQQMIAAGLSPQDAMHLMVTTQYIDTLKDFAANPNSSAIMVPSGPGAARDVEAQVRDGFITANALARPSQHAMR